MSKLQAIKRANGSVVNSVNIPIEIMSELSWEKGNDLHLEVKSIDGEKKILISKNIEEVNELEVNK